ncbi:hypothetical protein HYV56_02030 [Candidatus Peregrinibacteria bacterium]|nr:hypothetical protein [Candidatus Peregrinibacteria bacterium]
MDGESTTENQKTTKTEKIWAILSYASVIVIVPLILKRKNAFIQFHATQGLGMFVLSFITAFLALFIETISFLIFFSLLILSALNMIKAYQGLQWKIPIVYDIGHKITLFLFFEKL